MKDSPFDLRREDCWELSGIGDFPSLFRGLIGLLPKNCVMRFESLHPDEDVKKFLSLLSIPERTAIRKGTLWPKSWVFHVPVTEEILVQLAALTERCAEPEVADHFHVYADDRILVDWYDAFTDPMLVSKKISEDKVAAFCRELSATYKNMRT